MKNFRNILYGVDVATSPDKQVRIVLAWPRWFWRRCGSPKVSVILRGNEHIVWHHTDPGAACIAFMDRYEAIQKDVHLPPSRYLSSVVALEDAGFWPCGQHQFKWEDF